MNHLPQKKIALSIGRRLLIIVLLASLPVLSLFVLEFQQQQELSNEKVYQDAMFLAHLIAEDQEKLIEESKQFLKVLSLLPEVQQNDPDTCNKLFAQLLKDYPYYENIAMTNAKGDIIASALPFNNVNVSQRLYYKMAIKTKDFSVGDYQLGYITKKYTIHCAYPVLDKSGQVQLILAVPLNLKWIGENLNVRQLPQGASINILDQQGVILARYPSGEKWVGKKIPDHVALNDILTNRLGGTTRGPGIDGINKLYAFLPLVSSGGSEVFIAVGIPEQVAFADARKALQYNLLELGIITLVFILIWAGSNILIFKRLNRLVITANHLSEGKLSARTGLDYQGEIGYLASVFDKMAASLETEKKKLYSLIDELPGYVWVQAPDFFITFANKNFIQSFGDPRKGYCYEILQGRDKPCENCQTVNVFATQQSYGWEQAFYNQKTLEIYEKYLVDTDESPLVIKIGVDITEKTKMAQEMARLERLNVVGEMAAGISHEVRNPMTTVRGFLQMLKGKEDCAKYQDYYILMIDELDRANAIITEFLSIGRNTPFHLEKQNLNEIVNALAPLIQADAVGQDKDVWVETKEVPDLLLDGKGIRQVILNLSRNGLESMPRGGVLTIQTYLDKEHVTLAVSDQGEGIKPEVLEKLGTPFFTTKASGTGLGLGICYSIAARHNATIEIETGPTGTTFYVRFNLP